MRLLIIILLLSCSSNVIKKQDIQRLNTYGPKLSIINSISKKELKKHLDFLASDEMRGRETGTAELKIAARYIQNELKSYGYKPIPGVSSYYQSFDLYKSAFKKSSFRITYNNKNLNTRYSENITFYSPYYGDINLTGNAVYIGYGFNKKLEPVFKESDIKNKIVLRHIYSAEEEKTNKTLEHRSVRNRLLRMGAKAVITVLQEGDTRISFYSSHYEKLIDNLPVSVKKNKENYLYLIITNDLLNELLKNEKRSKLKKNKVYKFKKELNLSVNADTKPLKTQNVVAFLEGSDPELKKQIVGFSAHYDGLGINQNGEIRNGANDDGSGTVATLSIAKAISQDPPKRSTMIIFHCGEEKGLWGSDFFTSNPMVDLKQVVSVVNMDMVGSNYQPERVYVVGADRISQELHDINESVNASLDSIVLDYEWNEAFHPERIYYRSDHYHYAKKGIPVIFFSDKDPEHYHKPNDDIEFINFDKLRKITRLALSTGYYVANKKTRLKITNPVKEPIIAKETASKLTGSYSMSFGSTIQIFYRDRKLFVNFSGREMILTHVEKNKYHAMGIPINFKFGNNNSLANGVTVSFRGQNFEGKKVN